MIILILAVIGFILSVVLGFAIEKGFLREKKEKITKLKGLEEEESLPREEIDRDEDSLIVDIDEERLW